MDDKKNLTAQAGVEKLKELVDSIRICLFCTNLKTDDGSTTRPMSLKKLMMKEISGFSVELTAIKIGK